MANMRAKLRVSFVQEQFAWDDKTKKVFEIVSFNAVAASKYPEDGSDENNTFAKWSPSADVKIQIANPALWDTFTVGDEYYTDFTKAE